MFGDLRLKMSGSNVTFKIICLVLVTYIFGFYTGGVFKSDYQGTSYIRGLCTGISQIPADTSIRSLQISGISTTGNQSSQVPSGASIQAPWPQPAEPDLSRREKYPNIPGITFKSLSEVEIRNNMTPQEAENTFYSYLSHTDADCRDRQRFGHQRDGGWDVCLAGPYSPGKPCLIYSFGIERDWSFDDAISNQHNCFIRAFDPSNGLKDHVRGKKGLIHFYSKGLAGKDRVKVVRNTKRWQLRSFKNFLTSFNDTTKIIDYLKIDVEFSEWEALSSMIRDGSLSRVKQLGMEVHTREVGQVGRRYPVDVTSVRDFTGFYETLRRLESLGFRKWYTHSNPLGPYTSKRTKKKRSCCFEMIYINANVALAESNKNKISR